MDLVKVGVLLREGSVREYYSENTWNVHLSKEGSEHTRAVMGRRFQWAEDLVALGDTYISAAWVESEMLKTFSELVTLLAVE